jgi:uncharacterized protein YfaS (alpha-2-macroglobulin family)
VFDAEVDPEDVLPAVQLTPAVNLRAAHSGPGRVVQLVGRFAPETRYDVVLTTDLCASTGQCLEHPESFALVTGGGMPTVRMPTRETVLPPGKPLRLEFEAVERAALTFVGVPPESIGAALSLAGMHPTGEDVLKKLPPELRRAARRRTLDIEREAPNGRLEVDPFKEGPLVFVIAEARGARTAAGLFQRGELGTVLKTGPNGGLAWVTRMGSGAPVDGARVAVFRGREQLWSGTTNADGLATFGPHPALANERDNAPLFAVVARGDERSLVSSTWTQGIEPWMLDVPYYYWSGEQSVRGLLSAERGIYRPGEAVHLLGVLREKQGNGTLAVPSGVVEIEVTNPDGARVVNQRLPLTSFGTVRAEFTLPRDAEAGSYSARLKRGEATLWESFEVGGFRAATFELKLPTAGAAQKQGTDYLLPISANYLQGGAVAHGAITYTVSARPHRSALPGLEDVSFTPDEDGSDYLRPIHEGEATLDVRGEATLRVPESALPKPEDLKAQALDLVVEVTAKDATQREITGHTVQIVERSPVLAGVRSRQWITTPKQGWDVELVAVSPKGEPVVGKQLVVTLERTFWNTVAEQGPQGVRYRSSQETVQVLERRVPSTQAPTRLHLALPGGGDYRVSVGVEGQPFSASRSIWVYGSEATWSADNSATLDVKLDRESYAPKAVAKAFATIPYAKSTVLVTVEREGILDARVERLDGMDRPLEVPVSEAYLPNVFVGVIAVARDTQPDPAAGVPFRMGYGKLTVSAESRRLAVEVLPTNTVQEPGTEANVRVRVRDQAGAPVRAEVTLWAADEGVLMLTGYKTPDPFAPAYAPFELRVNTATNLVRWTRDDPSTWEDGGGDAAAGQDALRSKFFYTAFFSGGIVTDERGEGVARFPLPDNLTRWRVMAVVADAGQRFGKGEASIRVQKPLSIVPALPSHLAAGDVVDATFLVHNVTDRALPMEVELGAEGGRVLGQTTASLTVPAEAQAPVRFTVRAPHLGTLKLSARVRSGSLKDGVMIEVPVGLPTSKQESVIAEGTLAGTADESVSVPATARADSVGLEVRLGSGVLASLAAGYQALVDYPHGCAEQKTSRLIPMIALGDLARRFGRGLNQEEHRARLAQTLLELREHQNDDGGFGLWPDSESEPFVSAYVLWGWLTAQRAGYPVSEARLARGVAYLEEQVRQKQLEAGYFQVDPRVFTLLVLAQLGRDDLGLANALWTSRDKLDRFEQGLLAVALAQKDPAKARTLVSGLLAAARERHAGRSLVEEKPMQYGFLESGRDVRATATTLWALVALNRASEGEALAAGIVGARGRDGTWGTTFNNLWALHSLGAFTRARPPSLERTRVSVSLGGTLVGSLELSTKDPVGSVVIPQSALPKPGTTLPLTLSSSAGRPRYSVALTYALAADHERPSVQPFRITRRVLDAGTGKPVTRARVGQLLRVELELESAQDRNQVAVIDRLPGGLDALNPRLATERQSVDAGGDRWVEARVHDDRVTLFTYWLDRGKNHIAYLARAAAPGDFAWPAPQAEVMYAPDELSRGESARFVVSR